VSQRFSTSTRRYGRRGFLGALGAGAGAAVATATGVATAEAAGPLSPPPGNFGRMFDLPSFAPETEDVKTSLRDIGRIDGLLDAQDDTETPNNPDNPNHTAGVTFMGQFMDHDMTFDTESTLGETTAPDATPNARTPAFDLDSVYGGGPTNSPLLYQVPDKAKLRIESGGVFEDLPRHPTTKQAIIGDPRNDENLVIAGLHCAFILVHNRFVDNVRAAGTPEANVFATAKRLTTWHYHWLILREFLPLFVGPSMVSNVLVNGGRFYRPAVGQAFMPVEFQTAAYRFGHSLVRPGYPANRGNLAAGLAPFAAGIFDATIPPNDPDPDDLRGGARAPRRFIGWQSFFNFSGELFNDGPPRTPVTPPINNKKIDTKLSSPLFDLPLGAIASGDPPTSLAQRNLLRHLTWSMPSGQAIATKMQQSGISGVAPFSCPELAADPPARPVGFVNNTPLWYYILKEAQIASQAGQFLGPVGGRIVAEVIIGLLRSDAGSFLVASPAWRPSIPIANQAVGLRMTDFLRFARVDPVSRGP
jgi:hypothetical protein